MDVKENKIVIDGVSYLAVPDGGDYDCKQCALYKQCRDTDGMACEIFPEEIHFERER